MKIAEFKIVPILFALAVCSVNATASPQPYISSHSVNFASGNKYLKETDVSISGPGHGFRFTRTYNSQSTNNGPLGYGWSAPITEHLIIEDETITLVMAGGRYLPYDELDDGTYEANYGTRSTITKTGDGYVLDTGKGILRSYDGQGLITAVNHEAGTSLQFTYDGGNVVRTEDSFGGVLVYGYTDGKLTSIDSADGAYTYAYDGDNLTRVTKPDGTTTEYRYEDSGDAHNITSVVEHGLTMETTAYDDDDRVVETSLVGGDDPYTITYPSDLVRVVTDSTNSATTYTLEIQQGVAVIAESAGPGCASCGSSGAMSYTYDDRLHITTSTNALDVVEAATYDHFGNQLTKTYAQSTDQEYTRTYTYDPDTNKPVTITEPSVVNSDSSKISTLSYDDGGNLRSLTVAGFNSTGPISETFSFTYDALGRALTIDGPRTDLDDVTTITYYPNDASEGPNRGYLHTITNALNQVITYSDYTILGQPQTITDPNGLVTSIAYNADGTIETKTALGQTISYQYDDAKRPLTITLPGDRTLTYTYADNGKVASITDNAGNAIAYTYNSKGQVSRQEIQDPDGTLTAFVQYEYDGYSRLSKVINPNGTFAQTTFDAIGNVSAGIDELNQATSYGYDALRQLTSVTQPGETLSSFTYDLHGNRTSVTDPEGQVTTFSYDDLGRLEEKVSPDTGLATYTYNAAGNLLSKTDARDIAVSYAYDALGRVTEISYPDSSLDVSYVYDQGNRAIGKLSQVTDSTGSTLYAYNDYGLLSQVTQTIDGLNFTTRYGYNDSLELSEITYPSGKILAYQRNALGQIVGATLSQDDETTTLVENIAYLPFGPKTGMDLGNGLAFAASYDQQYRLSAATVGSIYSKEYTFRANGLVEGIADTLNSSRSQSFTYDSLNRLTTASGSYGSLGFSYDKVGNRLSKTAGDETTEYSYFDGTNQLSRVTAEDYADYSYDAAGNPEVMGTQELTWDAAGNLREILDLAGTQGQYSYDHRHLRSKKVTAEGTLLSIYDSAGNLIAEADGEGTILREFAYLGGERIALLEYTAPAGSTDSLVLGDLSLAQGTVSIKVTGDLLDQGTGSGVAGVECFLYAEDGTDEYVFTDLQGTTDAQGAISFSVPQNTYRVLAMYKGQQFWSRELAWNEDGTSEITVPSGLIVLTATEQYLASSGANVYLFDDQETYLNEAQVTNSNGQAVFMVPAASYKLRIDQNGASSWTDVVAVAAHSKTPITVNLDDATSEVGAAETVSAEDVPVATSDAVLADGGSIYWYITDHLGTAQLLTDANGAVVWQGEFSPFGQVETVVDQLSNRFRFPGQIVDAETGLYYNWNRYYNPETGRYISADPIGFAGGMNLYAYGANNPAYLIDIDGLNPGPIHPGNGPFGVVDYRTGYWIVDNTALFAFNTLANTANFAINTAWPVVELASSDDAIALTQSSPWPLDDLVVVSSRGLRIGVASLTRFNRVERCASNSTVNVFRVEGAGNQRLFTGSNGALSIEGNQTLFLNFGDEARAMQFLEKRLGQGFSDTTIKSFEVPTSYFDDLLRQSVPENMARQFPNSPFRVDVNQAANQLGLRQAQIEELNKLFGD